MAGVVDADTHIIEHPGMWELFDPELYPRRPVLASTTDNSVYGHNNQVWLIDGVAVPKRFGKGSAIVAVGGSDAEEARTDIAKAVRYITDASARVRDMDMRGVDAEVVFPTLLLGYLPVEVDLEVAICAAYNRYLAKAWEQGGDRLRWVVVPPLRDMQASVREIETARDHGAVGVFFRGVEGDRSLAESYFFPV
ncbi:MAG: amidohydrolase family protein, partial [Candidatus Binatia bacterium]